MFIFIILYFLSFIFVINTDDWFLVWLGMEINMMSFIYLIYMRNSLYNIECCLKYFFIQSLGSAIFMSLFYMNQYQQMYWGSMILSFKMGGGPFYFWFPSVSSGISWISFFVLMSFQKVIPLMLVTFFLSWIMWLIIMMSLILGAVGSFNQMNMKRLMAFSSIHHVGWLLLCSFMNMNFWIIYLMMYMLLVTPLIFMFTKYEVYDYMSVKKCEGKWWFTMMMLNMGGIPPMLGFFLKWISFYYIMNMNYMYIIMMIFMSVVMFYVYLRMAYDILLNNGMNLSWNLENMNYLFLFKMDSLTLMGFLVGSFLGLILINN